MFNDMRSEVRNLLLVASELGGAAAQYVKVLRAEKERLLPLDAVLAEMEELKAQAEQASAAEANMFKALTKANDRAFVVEKKAGELMGQLEQAQKHIATLQVTNDEYKAEMWLDDIAADHPHIVRCVLDNGRKWVRDGAKFVEVR